MNSDKMRATNETKNNIAENNTNNTNAKDEKDQDWKKSDQTAQEQQDHDEHYAISIENGSAKWLDYETEDTLKNININVRPGELIAVVGQVGSGKSSLMNVLLKELRLREGTIQVRP